MDDVIWVLWQISYAFQQCKNFDNRLRADKVAESLKVGTFLRHSVDELDGLPSTVMPLPAVTLTF